MMNSHPGRSPLLLRLIVSYIVMMILPLIFSLIVYARSYNMIERNTIDLNDIVLSQTTNAVDRILSDLNNTSKQLLSDRNIYSLLYAEQPLNANKLITVREIQSDLSRYNALSSYGGEIYLYFSASHSAASTSGYLREDSFTMLLSEKLGISMDDFNRACLAAKSTMRVYFSPNQDKIAFIASNATSLSAPSCTCLFVLDARIIRSILSVYDSSSHTEQRHIYFTNDGVSFLSYPSAQSVSNEVLTYARRENGNYGLTLDGTPTLLMVRSSALSDLKIICALPMQQYMGQITTLRNIYFILMALCLVAGIVIASLLARRNYKPIQRMTRMFLSRLNLPGGVKDEFGFLQSNMERVLVENEAYEGQVRRLKADLRDTWLIRMLHGKIVDMETFQTICSDYQLTFSGSVFFVLAVDVLAPSNEPPAPIDTQDNTASMVDYALGFVLERLLKRAFDAHIVVNNGVPFAILCVRGVRTKLELPSQEEPHRQAEDLCHEANGILSPDGTPVFRCYMSAAYEGCEGIQSAYQEAVWGLEQLECFAPAQCFTTRESFEHDASQSGEPSAQIMQLCAAIHEGALDAAYQYFSAMVRDCTASYEQSFFYVRLYAFQLFCQAATTLLERDADSFIAERRVPERIRALPDIHALHAYALELFEQLNSRLDALEQTQQKPDAPVNVIRRYVDDHFTSPDLTVASLSDHFSLSQSYLLRLFKASCHMGVLEYITHKRLNEAKRLLKASAVSVEQIAQAVGYTNSLALIRAFKKSEGITPTMYRNII